MQTYVDDREEEQSIAEAIVDAPAEKPIENPQISDLARFLKRTRSIVPLAVVGTFLLGGIAFLHFAESFVMPIVLAVLFSFLLKPVVRWVNKTRIPETLSALIVVAAFVALVFFGVTRLVQPASQWVARAPETIATIRDRFEVLFRRAERLSRAASQVEDIAKSPSSEPTQKVEVKQPALVHTVLSYTRSLFAGSIETVVLLFFMLAAGDMFMHKLVRVLPTLQDKKKAVEIANEVQHSISAFLFTITLINSILGILVGLSAWLIGLPNPVLWGVLAGLLNFIPYFGPITGVGVLLIAGFIAFDTVWRAILPAIIYLSLHGVEANLITPMVLGRRLTLNPLVIFISLMFWTWMWGIPGALLSVPMLMLLKILCDHFRPLAPIGEFLSG